MEKAAWTHEVRRCRQLSQPTRDKFSECELDESVRTRDVSSTVMPTAGNMTTVLMVAAGMEGGTLLEEEEGEQEEIRRI